MRNATPGAEILWDTWGVPHVFAPDAPGLFRAFGWAQTHSHGNLLLRLYAQGRGRAAEVFGPDFLASDRMVRTLGLHDLGPAWHRVQHPAFRANLDAFAAGVNAYAQAHPDRLDERAAAVLPVDATDVLAHGARLLALFLGFASGCLDAPPAGSNGWAISPSRTVGGHALLLANPHLAWSEEQTWYEAQLSCPGTYDAYGATLVGMPVLAIAFTDRLGWTATVNTIDACDLYALAPADGGYRFDGAVRPFETRAETIAVRQEDGSLREEELVVRRSVHGPVVEHHGRPVALRMAGVGAWSSAAGAYEQWWEMGRATDLAGFEAAMRRLQIPMFTFIYADRDGHVLSLFNGQVPVRPVADVDWSGPVPGDTSATLWTAVHPYDDLPRVVDPPGGWVQNANSPPWLTAVPPALDPATYPPYLAPRYLSFRERRGIRMLEERARFAFEDVVRAKHATRMELADRVLDELVAAARGADDAVARRAAEVLAAWDRQATADSRGALLFARWVAALDAADPYLLSDLFAVPWDPADPLSTPAGLADPAAAVRALAAAASEVEARFGRPDVPWGEVARLRRGAVDLPANGFRGDPFGVFRVLSVDLDRVMAEGRAEVIGGDSFVAVVEFADPVRAEVLLTYGNATQPGSPHVGDQLALVARGELRPAWRTRAEIEAHLEAHEVVG